MKIDLTPGEILQGAMIGVLRQCQNLQKNRPDRYGGEKMGAWQIHIEGALGEMAVAKALNKYWSGNLGNLDAPDVSRLQVRTTQGENNRLIVHPTDPDDDWFVLVIGKNGVYELKGCIKGIDAKREQFWRDPEGGRPAYFVPQQALAPLTVLHPKSG